MPSRLSFGSQHNIFYRGVLFSIFPLFQSVLDCSLLSRFVFFGGERQKPKTKRKLYSFRIIPSFFSNLQKSCRFCFYNFSQKHNARSYSRSDSPLPTSFRSSAPKPPAFSRNFSPVSVSTKFAKISTASGENYPLFSWISLVIHL